MKLPSISQAVTDARVAVVRFPIVVLDAIIGTACALIVADHQGPAEPTVLMQIIYGALLGFPLLAGLALTCEKRKWGTSASLGVQAAGVVLVCLYALTVPQDIGAAPNSHVVRLFMLIVGAILFGFAAPYVGHENELGYWNYCKSLCLRVLTAALYGGVLFAGLAIALAALDNLFGVEVPVRRYEELWVLIAGLFSTWFFLAGIPNDLDSLDDETAYPKGLKIFAQYILFPLVLVYVVILYAYLGKILVAWDWPQGWVSRLILGFIGTGFVTLVVLRPIRERAENLWITTASRWFYIVIIPLTVMLFLAVWQRVGEYGITEGRYLGIATVAWLCIVTPYFMFSRKKKILFLTTSLCVAVLVVSFGPWGMFSVSEKSQVNRLQDLLVKNHILVDGRVHSTHDSVQFESTRQISSIIEYLSAMHGFDAIQPWFAETLKRDSTGKGIAFKDPAQIATLMGVTYVRMWHVPSGGLMILTADRNATLDIAGYERLLRGLRIAAGGATHTFPDQGMTIRMGKDMSVMTVIVSQNMKSADSLQLDLKPLVNALVAEYGKSSMDRIQPDKMSIVAANRTMAVKMYFSTLRIQRRDQTTELLYLDADVACRLNSDVKQTEMH